MKKLLILSTILSSIFCSSVFAKDGHSVSIEASKINVDQTFGSTDYLGSNDKILPTLGYGYKMEFDKIFIKPSVYYTFGDIEIKDTGLVGEVFDSKSTFTPSLSIENDFGYKLSNNLDIFGTIGLMSANLEREVPGYGKDDTNSIGLILGVGLAYNINDQLSFTAKYQMGQFSYGVQDSSEDIEVDTSVIRVGLAMNF